MRRLPLVILVTLLACGPASGETTISADAYLDKLQGMWLGQLMGNYAGRRREGYYQSGGLVYDVNWTDPTHIDPVTGYNDYVFRDSPWGGDDDTCFEYLYTDVLKTNSDPSNSQIGQAWADHIAHPAFYIANRQARWRIAQGDTPPVTGSVNRNVHWLAIDSQITTETLGALAPAVRQRAADMAGRFGAVSNEGFPVHAAQYYSAMYASAAVESDVETIVAKGHEVVPTTSRTRKIIQDVRGWYDADKGDGTLDWRATQALIYDRYYTNSNGRYYGWVESSVNTAMTTLAILYGEGDFQQTVEIGVQAGFDSDCNPATAGGLIGLIVGYSGLPQDIKDRASDDYRASGYLINMTRDSTIPQIALDLQAAAEAQVIQMGGYITGTGAARTYHVPDDVLGAKVEKPDPAGPKGLVGQVQALEGTVTVGASIENHDPTDDPANLEGIIDGICDVTYNGHRPYTTDDGANSQPAGGDYYQLNFDRHVLIDSVIFYEGNLRLGYTNAFPDDPAYPPKGGFFTDLTVEVCDNGVFSEVEGLSFSEPLDAYKFHQMITLSFDDVVGDAVRIRGTAGGTYEFTTIVELEAYGKILIPADANLDDNVNLADFTILKANFGQPGGWCDGNFNDDTEVNLADFTILKNNFGGGASTSAVPEPASAMLLLGAFAAVICRRRQP